MHTTKGNRRAHSAAQRAATAGAQASEWGAQWARAHLASKLSGSLPFVQVGMPGTGTARASTGSRNCLGCRWYESRHCPRHTWASIGNTCEHEMMVTGTGLDSTPSSQGGAGWVRVGEGAGLGTDPLHWFGRRSWRGPLTSCAQGRSPRLQTKRSAATTGEPNTPVAHTHLQPLQLTTEHSSPK
jgi:hypothetical protein